MCVGIPAQVVEILAAEKKAAIVEVEGVRREVSIVVVLDDGVKVGDWVLLHVGFAMSIIDEEEAGAGNAAIAQFDCIDRQRRAR